MTFERPILKKITARLSENTFRIQILLGARQVGKTTLIHQAIKKIDFPSHYVIAEGGMNTQWIEQQWGYVRAQSNDSSKGALLVIDEIQKIENWSERVKRLFDEDRIKQKNVKVVLLGSSSLLLQKGLSESMAGRFEVIPVPHWSFDECQQAFDMTLDEFTYFGGYPGALPLRFDEERFFSYIHDAIVEPVVSRDILSQCIIHKPALLRELFRLGSEYSGQILSYNKMLGQLQDAGNTTTLAHYLNLLEQSYVIKGLHKFTNELVRQRQSPPKFQVFNTALQTNVHKKGFKNAMSDYEYRGRLVESAVGAYLLSIPHIDVAYWREDNQEVDFIASIKGKKIAIEVKSGKKITSLSGLDSFHKKFKADIKLLVGTGGIPIDIFLKTPIEQFL
ncbi:MAG: AAA family ATPase [Pseudomonadota bacterium]